MEQYFPHVTINILCFNSLPGIKRVLHNVDKIKYPKNKLEVIVVDNASVDGTPEYIRKNFTGIKLITLSQNSGVSSWNEGFKVMRGDYCLVLDDDSYIEPDGIKKAIDIFQRSQSTGIIACNILNPYSKTTEFKYMNLKGDKPVEWCDFVGGGVFISKRVFVNVGLFAQNIFIYGHEAEFSLRVMNAGFKILFTPHIKVLRVSPPNVLDGFRVMHGMSNLIGTAWKYLSIPNAISVTTALLSEYMLLSLKNGLLNNYFLGLFAGIRNVSYAVKNRNRISSEAERKWTRIYPFTLTNLFKRAIGKYLIE